MKLTAGGGRLMGNGLILSAANRRPQLMRDPLGCQEQSGLSELALGE
jgi:hypothetical protein